MKRQEAEKSFSGDGRKACPASKRLYLLNTFYERIYDYIESGSVQLGKRVDTGGARFTPIGSGDSR